MTKSPHTPGPTWIDDDGCIAAGKGDNYVTIADPHCSNLAVPENECPTVANAGLLCAAYNAFDSAARKLGLDAIEFAESMQDSKLSDVIDALERTSFLLRRISEGDHHAFENAAEAADAAYLILAKVNGGPE
jgi:hypothetical protein